MEELKVNPGKKLTIKIGQRIFERWPIKTHIITPKDDFLRVVEKYALPHLKSGDILVLAEKALSISQGRAYNVEKIKPSRLARFLTRFITQTPYGIGCSIPETMEIGIREVGAPRIILAAALAAVTKPFGIRGVFYRVAGPDVKAIDGPADYVIPPYNKYASLGPKDPDKIAEKISKKIKHQVVVIDACDLGCWILGASESVDRDSICPIFADNPLGQTDQQTPMCIVRKARLAG